MCRASSLVGRINRYPRCIGYRLRSVQQAGQHATGWRWALQAPSKVQVPTLAFDDQQIILVWEKPVDHADIVDYHVYANGKFLGGSNANNAQVSPAKPYIDNFYEQDTRHFHHRIAIHSYTAEGLRGCLRNGCTWQYCVENDLACEPRLGAPAKNAHLQHVKSSATPTVSRSFLRGRHRYCLAFVRLSCKHPLRPDTEYRFTVRSVGRDGKESIDSPVTVQRTTAVPVFFDVKRYGPKGDGKTLDTAAIQAAIDAYTVACKVLLPAGIYKSGSLYLKSNMTLEIAEGATLLGSERPEDYPRAGYIQYPYSTTVRPASLINALPRDPHRHQKIENIRIVGKGTIDGNCDGIEFVNSQGAMVFNNFFDTGDGCVNFAAGTGGDAVKQKTQDGAWIFNNFFGKGHGMVVAGSHTGAWIQNILAEDNVSEGTDAGLRMIEHQFHGRWRAPSHLL